MKRFIAVFAAVLLVAVSLCMPVFAAENDGGNDGFVSGLLDGIKRLFVPDKDYFTSFREDITSRFNAKFGAVASALEYLNTRFLNLRAYKNLDDIFKVVFPKNSFLNGISVNFLTFASPVLAFIRECITGLCCILTAILCYRRVIDMVNT